MSERKLAKCGNFDFGIEDHGMPVLWGDFEYDEGGVQGLGYQVDVAFLMRFMGVFGVREMGDVNGRSCWVVQDDKGDIRRIEPLHRADGEAFDIDEWAKWKAARDPGVSAYEMLTGKMP